MKVFLDTNVLVSAFAARGLCADLFRYLLSEHEILTGDVNLIELQHVLRDKLGANSGQIAAVYDLLREQTVVPRPDSPGPLRLRDRDDEWVLASAIAGGADMLITGDKDLLAVAERAPVPVLSPRAAWERLRGPG